MICAYHLSANLQVPNTNMPRRDAVQCWALSVYPSDSLFPPLTCECTNTRFREKAAFFLSLRHLMSCFTRPESRRTIYLSIHRLGRRAPFAFLFQTDVCMSGVLQPSSLPSSSIQSTFHSPLLSTFPQPASLCVSRKRERESIELHKYNGQEKEKMIIYSVSVSIQI